MAQAFPIGEGFLDSAPSALVLGDNIFFVHALSEKLRRAAAKESGATVFGYYVSDPRA